MNSSILCCSNITVSADVIHPLQLSKKNMNLTDYETSKAPFFSMEQMPRLYTDINSVQTHEHNPDMDVTDLFKEISQKAKIIYLDNMQPNPQNF